MSVPPVVGQLDRRIRSWACIYPGYAAGLPFYSPQGHREMLTFGELGDLLMTLLSKKRNSPDVGTAIAWLTSPPHMSPGLCLPRVCCVAAVL